MTRCDRLVIGIAGSALVLQVVAWCADIGPGRQYAVRLNLTASLPRGFYVCRRRKPVAMIPRGTLVALTPPHAVMAELARLAPQVHVHQMLKRVAAVAGDTVCRWGTEVAINGQVVAQRPLLATYPMVTQDGCVTLDAAEVFVLGAHPHSYDSRYYGPLRLESVDARCTPVWTWEGAQ